MYKYLISIIVPVYNVEKYIEQCLDSLVNQTYKNTEIIIVDDGATDNSGAIADTYAEKYNYVKVIHTENGGLSSARNIGIENSTGQYITFVDSDDWIDFNLIEHLVNILIDNDCDFVSYGLLKEYDTVTEQNYKMVSFINYNQKQIFNHILNDNSIAGYACNKLFSREIIGDDRFDETLLSCEDIDFCVRIAAKSLKAVHVDANFYHYRQHTNSMTGDFGYSVRKLSIIKAYENIKPYYQQFDIDDIYIIDRNILKQNLNVKGRMIRSNIQDKETLAMLNGNIKKYYSSVMRNCNNSIVVKANIFLTRIFPSLSLLLKQFILNKKRGLNDE